MISKPVKWLVVVVAEKGNGVKTIPNLNSKREAYKVAMENRKSGPIIRDGHTYTVRG